MPRLNSPGWLIARLYNFAASKLMTELDLLKKPAYIYVLLNHLPIYGTLPGALAQAISLILRSRAAQITPLITTLVAGSSAYPVFVTGQRGYKTIRGVRTTGEPIGSWIELKRALVLSILLPALAIAGLLVPINWPKSAVPLAALTLVVAILCSGLRYIAPTRRLSKASRISAGVKLNSSF
ncbi:MAG: hypothetical protein JO334_17170 [Verrucomicrobia bacterium]|nr:hypothetical protein [Verrucomicrobiota bacterium]